MTQIFASIILVGFLLGTLRSPESDCICRTKTKTPIFEQTAHKTFCFREKNLVWKEKNVLPR